MKDVKVPSIPGFERKTHNTGLFNNRQDERAHMRGRKWTAQLYVLTLT